MVGTLPKIECSIRIVEVLGQCINNTNTGAIALQVLALDPMPPSTLDGLHIIAIVLAWCPTFVNPIVYFYLDNKFYRRELQNWFRELGEWRPRQKKHSLGMQNGKLWIDRRNIISTLPGDTTISTLPFNQ